MPDKERNEIRVELLVNFLYPNIILKGDSFTLQGEKIWDGNKPIPENVIENLKKRKVQKIYYNRPQKEAKPKASNPMIDEAVLEKAVDINQELENAVTKMEMIPAKGVNEVIDSFIGNLQNTEGTVLNLMELKEFDDYTYTHSINVCLISMLFAKKLSYNEKGIKIIGISGLLHDIGKLMISKDILNKPIKLTSDEFEIVKKHPVLGYQYIKSQSQYGSLIQKAVLLHHERYSGKGYPLGLRGEQIGEIAQIISLADIFDAISSERPYKSARPFWYALSTITKESGVSFSPRLTKTFVQDMPRFLTEEPIFQIGLFVLLNTGEVGEVIDYDFPQSLRPVVNIYLTGKKTPVRYPIPVNLKFDDSRSIESVFEDEKIIEKLNEVKSRFVKPSKEEPKQELKEIEKEISEEKKEEEEYQKDHPTEVAVPEEIPDEIDSDILEEDEKALK